MMGNEIRTAGYLEILNFLQKHNPDIPDDVGVLIMGEAEELSSVYLWPGGKSEINPKTVDGEIQAYDYLDIPNIVLVWLAAESPD